MDAADVAHPGGQATVTPHVTLQMQRASQLLATDFTVSGDVLGVEHEDVPSHGVLGQGLPAFVAGVHLLPLDPALGLAVHQAQPVGVSPVVVQRELALELVPADFAAESGSHFLAVTLPEVVRDALLRAGGERFRAEGATQQPFLRAAADQSHSVHRPGVLPGQTSVPVRPPAHLAVRWSLRCMQESDVVQQALSGGALFAALVARKRWTLAVLAFAAVLARLVLLQEKLVSEGPSAGCTLCGSSWLGVCTLDVTLQSLSGRVVLVTLAALKTFPFTVASLVLTTTTGTSLAFARKDLGFTRLSACAYAAVQRSLLGIGCYASPLKVVPQGVLSSTLPATLFALVLSAFSFTLITEFPVNLSFVSVHQASLFEDSAASVAGEAPLLGVNLTPMLGQFQVSSCRKRCWTAAALEQRFLSWRAHSEILIL